MKNIRAIVFIFCFLLPFLGFAQKSSNTKNEGNIDRLLDMVSVKQTLNELPKDLKTQFSQNPFGISSSKNEQLLELFANAYNADSLSKIAQKSFEENFDPSYYDSVLAVLKSEAIKPILNTKADFYTVQGIRKQIVTKYELEQNEPSQKRISIIKDIIQHRSAKQSEIESKTMLFRSLVIGTDAISSKLSLSETQINGVVNNFNDRMQMQLENELLNKYLVMYHGLRDDQLTKYADFYASEAGTKFIESLNEAIYIAFQESSDRFISSVESL